MIRNCRLIIPAFFWFASDGIWLMVRGFDRVLRVVYNTPREAWMKVLVLPTHTTMAKNEFLQFHKESPA